MLEITPVDMNLSLEWKQEKVLSGSLHSEFERVRNYLFTIDSEEKMLTVMCEGNTLLPDSIILRHVDYEHLKKQEVNWAEKSEDYIRINNVKIALIKISDCSLLNLPTDKYNREYFENKREQISSFITCSEKKSDFERLPERYKKALNSFADAITSNESEAMIISFFEIIGAGRGLTPAADDALVGVLAGNLLKLSLEKKSDMYFDMVNPILSYLCKEKLTTQVSLKYLKCACHGAFSQDLCKLIRILSGELNEDIKKLLERTGAIGHSSGMDMLYGLETILQRE